MSSQSAPRHPVGLYVLCVAELCERFAGYLLGAALVLYLNERLGLQVGRSARIYGSFGALSYGLSLVGGLLADRWLGCRRALLCGALLLAGGFLMLGFDVHAALWPPLVLLIAGNALFKPSAIALLDRLCPRDDARRDAGYRMFHIAINAGALLGPVASGAVRSIYSWRALFLLGAVSMGLAVLVCLLGWRMLRTAEHAEPKEPPPNSTQSRDGFARTPVAALLTVLLGIIAFATLHSQTGSTLLFFARDHIDRNVLGHEIPPEWSASLLCTLALVFLVTLPVLLRLLRRRGLAISAPRQMSIGLLFASLAYVVMIGAAFALRAKLLISPLWLLACFISLELAEVTVSPISMSLVAKLAPRRWAASAGSLWLVATALGFFFGGESGARWGTWSPAIFFTVLAMIGFVASAWLGIFTPCIHSANPPAAATR